MKTGPALLLLLSAALGGCVDTIFESQPGDKIADCDAHFVGKWRLISPDQKSADEVFVIFDPACKAWHFIEDGKEDIDTGKTVHFAFASVAGKPVLTVKMDADLKDANERDAAWRNGYHYFRYDVAGGSIRLHPIDDRRVAHLIIDEKILGRTEKISRNPGGGRPGDSVTFHNFVAGNAAEMARIVQLQGLFTDANSYVLKPASDAEIYKAGKTPAHPP